MVCYLQIFCCVIAHDIDRSCSGKSMTVLAKLVFWQCICLCAMDSYFHWFLSLIFVATSVVSENDFDMIYRVQNAQFRTRLYQVPPKMCKIKEKCVFIEKEKPAWLVTSMDDQNLSSGVGIIYHIPTQAPFITHRRSGWHPVWDFCFPKHRLWGFGSSGLIHWVAMSLIHDVSKECTASYDPWRGKQYIPSKHWESVTMLLSITNSAKIFEALHISLSGLPVVMCKDLSFCMEKKPTRYHFVLSFISRLQVAQYVSGNHVPIFRSWRLRSVITTCWYCAVAAGRLSEPVSR